jgi:Leucine-rich repeat (LRR) protein
LLISEDGTVDLSNKGLKEFPKELFTPENVKRIKTLNLSYNRISVIPDAIATLTNLQILHLSSNRISVIPDAIATLTSLQKLYLNNNQISVIPDAIANANAALTNLQILDLSSNRISVIPDAIAALTNLQILDFYNNQISVIPDAIAALTNLQILHLYNNRISVIPDAIAALTNLQILHLSSNRISVIPDAIATLTSLQKLYLNNNQISVIPVSLSRLRNLISFLFSGNPIEYIPPQIRRLLERQKTGQNIYQDHQSVHNSKIQESFRKTVEKLSQRKPKLTENQTLEEILTSKLNLESKNGLLEWCFEKEIYSLNLTFLEILVFVWDRIRCHPSKEEILKVLDSELQDAICKCPTGRVTRLVNCLNGFDPEVVLEISENEQISYLYDIAKKSEDPKKMFIEMMQERKYNQSVIDLWSSEM